MIDTCKSKFKNCYNPYSKFFVVSSVLLRNDQSVYGGCNIENASYGLTMCAERVAIYNAFANTEQENRMIEAMLIYSPDKNPFIYPCGACRQVINEFSDDYTKIILANDFDIKVCHIDELLPKSFGPKDLNMAL
jgi:cytidine deaminase